MCSVRVKEERTGENGEGKDQMEPKHENQIRSELLKMLRNPKDLPTNFSKNSHAYSIHNLQFPTTYISVIIVV